ncbi:MAG: hypothetical protein ACK4NC_04000 [Candidatus Gracilibacteria bacterium]
MIGKIVEHVPEEIVTVEYNGFLQGGVEDYESEMVKSFTGTTETYRLSSNEDGVSHLSIEAPMDEDNYDSMSIAWEKALVKIKELSEKK